jgi:F0F1-type ATP synthase gamma subunit
MQGVLETFEELAASSMQKLRVEIGLSQDFYHGLSSLSEEVGADWDGALPGEKMREAVVLVSANGGLFGDIVEKVIAEFVTYVQNNNCEVYVMGQWGANLVRRYMPELKFEYVSMPDESLPTEVLSSIIARLGDYREVKFFYGQFVNIARQEPTSRRISGELRMDFLPHDEQEQRTRQLKYIYEPDFAEVGRKFGQEIFAGVFDNTLREAQLAKYASRLMHLDQAISRMDIRMVALGHEEQRAKKREENRKQSLRVAASKMKGRGRV